MTAISVTIVGNLTADPELRFGSTGVPVVSFTVASNERFKDQAGAWQDGPTSFVRCAAWRELAEHIAESAQKGDRLIVTGAMRQRDYQTSAGENRTVWEVAVTEAGAALRYATARISKVKRDSAPVPDGPYPAAPAPSGPADPWAGAGQPDEPPF